MVHLVNQLQEAIQESRSLHDAFKKEQDERAAKET
jgi:hypothetical protein